jgi:hypothetical protein
MIYTVRAILHIVHAGVHVVMSMDTGSRLAGGRYVTICFANGSTIRERREGEKQKRRDEPANTHNGSIRCLEFADKRYRANDQISGATRSR